MRTLRAAANLLEAIGTFTMYALALLALIGPHIHG